MLFTVIRHKTGECVGVYSTFAKASDALQHHMTERENGIEHVSSSDAEGWMQIETTNGEFYTIQVNELDKEPS